MGEAEHEKGGLAVVVMVDEGEQLDVGRSSSRWKPGSIRTATIAAGALGTGAASGSAPPGRRSEDDVGEPVDLLGVRNGGVEHQLVHAHVGVRLRGAGNRLGGTEGAPRDHLATSCPIGV